MEFCDVFVCSDNQEAKAILIAAAVGLIGAVAAVVAAFIVGHRQIEIIRRQVEIADQALRLEALKVRVEVFDKRMSVYERTRDFLEFWVVHDRIAGYPKVKGEGTPVEEMTVRRDFIAAMQESQFLFQPSVHKRLRELFALSKKLHSNQRAMHTPLGTPGREEAFEKDERLSEDLQEIHSDLPSLFGDELNLSDAAVMGPVRP